MDDRSGSDEPDQVDADAVLGLARDIDRVAALESYDILDTPAEPGFDDIVLLACQICEAPVALVCLIAADRQWYKAKIGTELCETPLNQSVCMHALKQPGLLIIPDLSVDPRTRENPLVAGEPCLRFYAGARLETPEGLALGTLCVVDLQARPAGLKPNQAIALEALARQVMTQMELRRTAAARDKALRAVREGDLRRKQILESAVDYAIVAMGRDGRVTDWNTGAERMFGWTAEEMRGQPIARFFTPEDLAEDRVTYEMRRAMEQGRGNDERWHVRKGGARFWATGEMMPLRDADGEHLGFIKIVRDETDKRAAAEKQRTDREFLESVLASSDDCISVIDLDANLIFMSEGGQRIMEVGSFDTVRGCRWVDFWPDDLRATAKDAIATAKGGGSGHFQGLANTFAGTPRFWDVRVRPIIDATGEPEKLLAISRDITIARQAEETLREAQSLNTLILTSSADCIVVIDLEGRTQFVSPGGIEAMEISDVDSIIGLSWLRVWKDEADQAAAQAAVAAARDGRIGRFQGFCPTHKGTPKWWDVMISPMPGADGRPERLVSVGRDITLSKQTEQALARSDERLKLALGASGMIGVWDWDIKTDLVYADENYARIFSVDPAWAARGAPMGEYLKNLHTDDRPAFHAELDRLLAGAAEFSQEYRILQPDGSVRWVLARGQLVRALDGSPLRFPGASVEITDRKQSETRRLALLNLGDRLRDMDDPAEMAFVAAEIMGRTLAASRAGYGTVDPVAELVVIERDWALPGIDSIAGNHAFRDFGSYIDDLKRGSTVAIDDVEHDGRTATNADALEAISIRSMINIPVFERGRFVAIFFLHAAGARRWGAEEVAFARNTADRTWAAIERRHAERRVQDLNSELEQRVETRTRELKQSQARMQAYFSASPEYLSVVRLTAEDTLVYDDLNVASEVIFGAKRSEVVGKRPSELLNPKSAESVEFHARECLRTGRALRYEAERTYKAGLSIVANVVVAPIELPDRGGSLVLFCGRDLTEQRRAEEALRQSQKMEVVGQLTGGVAHDFNNLLTVIRSSVDLLKRPNLAEARRQRYIEAISDTTTRAAKLTGQLLAFARRQALKPEVFDVVTTVADMSEMFATLTGSRIKIETRVFDEACFINADPSQFETALVNLAVNARDAMDGEGRLTLAVRATSQIPAMRAHGPVQGHFVAVSIADTGSGIAPQDIERIFEPFFTTKQVGQGTGLGLSQVFGFVKQSGGEVAVTSEPGQGTTFTLYLPRTALQAGAARSETAESLIVDGHGTCVLVIEDNEDVGSFTTQALAELGYHTVLAESAKAALDELEHDAERFDVVFSDVVMPGMNGIDLAHEVRRRHADLSIVLTSGYSHVLAEDGTHGFELLHKPYSIEQLSRVLQKAARLRQLTRVSHV